VFTGIVEEVGTLLAREGLGEAGGEATAARLRIRARKALEGVALGDSIAVNGVCLTVTGSDGDEWTTDVMAETLRRSSLGALGAGDPVNLERAVTPHTRLGGHLVQGHVDGVGTVLTRTPGEHWEVVRVALPPELARYVVEKGSITVDGVSLTITDLSEDAFATALVPHTLEVTTMGSLKPGDGVNLEVDVLAKYVERLVARAP